ncbi:MAG: hypothetical protein ABI777_05825 [Betaproteobacteria bacterium]
MQSQHLARIGIALCAFLLPLQLAYAQAPGDRQAGEVVSLEGGMLTIKSSNGQPVSVALADNVRVTLRSKGDLAKLDSGLYVGATATPQPDGTLLASQISIFPESLRGTAEGHRPMANLPGSTMTNATVKQAAKATVTNASVTGISGTAEARKLVLTYAGGEQTVIVPPSAAIVLSEIGDRAALTPGAKVIIYVTRKPDGSMVSERVSVGKNGSVPLS